MMADLIVMTVGGIVAVLGLVCAILEERHWKGLEYDEPTRAMHLLHRTLGVWMFDCYRGATVAGGAAIVVGLANLLIPLAAPGGAAHINGAVAVPIGISWSWKFGVLFFLWVRCQRLWAGE